ncbi:MAG: RNA polymerase sigma factor [Dehalococcoidales bacterium]|nr:RNA polymerase sigma factor [Dehalococcoidales bacterium]
MSEQDALSLAAAAAAGDRQAFAQLYDLYVDRVYHYIYYRLGSARDAEDLTENVFLKAWQAMRRYQPNGTPVFAWLVRIAHNALIDHLRTSRETAPIEEIAEDAVEGAHWADPVQAADLRCTQGQLRRAILGLKPEQQQVIIMRFIDEMSHAQVADALEKTEGAVRVIQHRALAALRQAMAEEMA